MVRTCVDSNLKALARLESDPRMYASMREQIQKLQVELKFLKMFIWCLAKLNGANKNLETSIKAAISKTKARLNTAAAKALQGENTEYWDRLASGLLKKVKEFKPTIKATCLDLLDCSLQCKSSYDWSELFEFLETILESLNYMYRNLNNVFNLSIDMIFNMKQGIVILEKKFTMLRNFSDFDKKPWINHEEFKDLKIQIQSWTYNTARVLLLHWVDMESEEALKMNRLPFNMMEKSTPGALDVAMYFDVLKASKSSRSDISLVAEVVNDDTEILHEGLMFLGSLLLHPPEGASEDANIISTQVDAIIKEAAFLISLYCSGEVKEDIAEENNVLLSNFIEKVKMIKQKVRQLHVQIQNSSLLDFPQTNALGFMDFLLRNLEEKLKCKSIPFVKHQMLAVREGLMSMMPILKDILQLQNGCSETKDLWKQIINVAYQAEHVIDSTLDGYSPIWCNMIGLSNVMEEIESIATKVKKMKDNHKFNIRSVIPVEMNFSQIRTSEANGVPGSQVFVGFKDEEEVIIDRLKIGSMERDIISIVGMPGLGKTTLAKKVYDSPFVQSQFHKHAWCCVSQSYQRRELLSTILKDFDTSTNKIQEKGEEDLEHLLYRSLKGQRYLIVLDDIWDIEAWNELEKSFPNDINGSRIMLTSRIVDVALQINPTCCPHFLPLISDAECWELQTKKLFHRNDCPANLLGVGMQIAKKCKGLPLAVNVIAGLLAKAVRDLDWWRKIEKSLASHIAGCMDILELSYNHLPDFLKPCFLYFGAFKEDQKINAKDLTLLWVAEGFILNPGCKSLEEVAQEYLMDLVGRNLVSATRETSSGMIRECSMHDLIRELCSRKAKEENFMKLVYEVDVKAKPVCSPSNPTRYVNYRLGIHADPRSFVDSNASGPRVRSLLLFSPSAYLKLCHIVNIFNSFKFLNVLHLCVLIPYFNNLFPMELTLLVHLRYLAILDGIYQPIPPSIANLKNLETFRLKGNSVHELPNTIWEMKRLRHFNVNFHSISFGDDMPENLNQLDNIESFSKLYLFHAMDVEKLFRRIPTVRKLKFNVFESGVNQFSVLDSLSKLESLSLRYLTSELEPYPYVISFPSSLKKLTLSGLCRPWREISAIGKLPNLEVLKLYEYAFVGKIWDVEDDEFLNLKCLKLKEMNIMRWNASSDPFPCLQQLHLKLCSRLQEIPSSFGTISTLKIIRVHWCSDNAESSAKQIVEEQRDLGNEDIEFDIEQIGGCSHLNARIVSL